LVIGDNGTGHEDRRFPELHQPVGVVLQEAHENHEAVDGMDGVLRAEADLLDRFDGSVRCLRAHAMGLRERGHRQAHLVGVGGVLCGADGPLLGPIQRLLDRVRKEVPAADPLTMLTVSPSMPADAPRAAFPAACSILDRPVLMLLIEAFALLTSTSTTSSSLLLSAMGYTPTQGRCSYGDLLR
jgi:hypothetical protein